MEGNRIVVILVLSVVFASVMLAIQGLYWYNVNRQHQQSRELARRLGTLSEGSTERIFKHDPLENERKVGFRSRLAMLLLQAGSDMDVNGLLSRSALFAFIGVLLMFPIMRSPLGLVGVVFGMIPIVRVQGQAEARSRKITEQLPNALDLISRSLQSGHGVAEAFRNCAEEMPPPISLEFARVYEEHNLGRDFRDAMQNMVKRNGDNFDVKIFVSSVLLQRDTGGNLIEILGNIADTIRQRFVFKGKVRALTAEAKFSAIILGTLPFGALGILIYVNPTYLLPLATDPFGRVLVGYAVTSFLVGVFVMREISKVEV